MQHCVHPIRFAIVAVCFAVLQSSCGDGALVVNDSSLSTAEDTAIVAALVQGSARNVTFEVTTPPSHGTVAIDDGVMTYSPEANYAGADRVIVSTTRDGESASATIDITIDAVNDAPQITVPRRLIAGHDEPVSFGSASRIVVADVDAGEDELTVSLSVDTGDLTLASISALTLTSGDGEHDVAIAFRGKLDAIAAALDGLTYTPAALHGTFATVTILVGDGGSTGAGGPQTAEGTALIAMAPAPAPPVTFVPDARTVAAGSSIVFDGSVQVSYFLASEDTLLEIALSVEHGTLTLGGSTGITIIEGSDGSSALRMSGGIDDLNAALHALTYTAAADYVGVDTLTMTSKAADGLSSTETCTITITAD